jgi:hypothetical protein
MQKGILMARALNELDRTQTGSALKTLREDLAKLGDLGKHVENSDGSIAYIVVLNSSDQRQAQQQINVAALRLQESVAYLESAILAAKEGLDILRTTSSFLSAKGKLAEYEKGVEVETARLKQLEEGMKK